MVKLAILNSVSFEKKNTFKEINEIENYLKDKIVFENYNNTTNMLQLIKNIILENDEQTLEITNCFYDNKNIIQSFHVDNPNDAVHKHVIFVKRKIRENTNDSYTFSEYTEESDPYVYEDVTSTDIINILTQKSVINCVKIPCDDPICDDKIIILNGNDDVGKFILKNDNKETLFLNVANVVNMCNNKEHENQIEMIINLDVILKVNIC